MKKKKFRNDIQINSKLLESPQKKKHPVLDRAGITSMHTFIKQRHMRWLGHVTRMEDGRIQKDLLYEKLASGKRPLRRPKLHYKDTCKSELKVTCHQYNHLGSSHCRPMRLEAGVAERSFQIWGWPVAMGRWEMAPEEGSPALDFIVTLDAAPKLTSNGTSPWSFRIVYYYIFLTKV